MPLKTENGAERVERAAVAFFFRAVRNLSKDAFGKRVKKVEYKREPSSGYLQPVKATAYVDDILVLENDEPMAYDYQLKYHNELTPTGIEGRTETSSGNTAYYIKDHLGSVRSVVDDQGQLVEATMYDAYGRQYVQAYGPERFKERFSGKEFDEDGAYAEYNVDGIGLNYFGFRYYDPVVGMWTTVDPMEEFYSPYTYCANNPMNFTDPLGLFIPENEKKNDFVADKIRDGGNDGPRHDRDVGWAGWGDNPDVKIVSDAFGNLDVASKNKDENYDATTSHKMDPIEVKGEKDIDGPHGEKDIADKSNWTPEQEVFSFTHKTNLKLKKELIDLYKFSPEMWEALKKFSEAMGPLSTGNKVVDKLLGFLPYMDFGLEAVQDATSTIQDIDIKGNVEKSLIDLNNNVKSLEKSFLDIYNLPWW